MNLGLCERSHVVGGKSNFFVTGFCAKGCLLTHFDNNSEMIKRRRRRRRRRKLMKKSTEIKTTNRQNQGMMINFSGTRSNFLLNNRNR